MNLGLLTDIVTSVATKKRTVRTNFVFALKTNQLACSTMVRTALYLLIIFLGLYDFFAEFVLESVCKPWCRSWVLLLLSYLL